jgi:hypothetical protein
LYFNVKKRHHERQKMKFFKHLNLSKIKRRLTKAKIEGYFFVAFCIKLERMFKTRVTFIHPFTRIL